MRIDETPKRWHGYPVSPAMDMAKTPTNQRASASLASAPPVRIEVRSGNSKPIVLDITGEEFLIGSVAGCDLKLPGTNLPPVVCLLMRQIDGLKIRKLSPVLPILVNGQPISQTALNPLQHGDTISIGAVDISVEVAFRIPGGIQFVPVNNEKSNPTTSVVQPIQESIDLSTPVRANPSESIPASTVPHHGIYPKPDHLTAVARMNETLSSPAAQQEFSGNQTSPTYRQAIRADLQTLEHNPHYQQALKALEQLQLATEQKRIEFETKIAETEKVREELFGTRNDLHNQFREKREQLNHTQESLKQAQAQFQQRQRKIENELIKLRQETESELYQRRQQFERDHLERIESSRKELAEFSAKQELLQKQWEAEWRSQLEANWKRELEAKTSDHQKTLADLEAKHQDALDQLKKLVGTEKNEIDSKWQQKLSEKEAEKNDLESKWQQKLSEQEAEWLEQSSQKETEWQDQQTLHASLVRESQEREQSLRKQIVDLQEKFVTQLSELNAIKADREQLVVRLSQMQMTTADEQQALRESIQNELQTQFQEQYRERGKELDRYQLTLREMALELKQQRDRFQEAQTAFENERNALMSLQTENLNDATKALHETAEQKELELRNREKALNETTEQKELELRQKELALIQKEAALAEREQETANRDKLLTERQQAVAALEVQQTEVAKAPVVRENPISTVSEADILAYQNDLVRLDRRAETLENREKEISDRSLELDRRQDILEINAREQEELVRQIDSWQERLRGYEQETTQLQKSLHQKERQLLERTARLEAQQTTLALLRTRLEQMREEVHQEISRLATERGQHLEQANQFQQTHREMERLRNELSTEKQGYSESARVLQERSALMQQAVVRMRELQERLVQDEDRLRRWQLDLESNASKQIEQEGYVQARLRQLQELQDRVEADREAIRLRETMLSETDGTRGILQEQLRRRSEELSARKRELDDKANQLEEHTRLLNEQATELERLRSETLQAHTHSSSANLHLQEREHELRVQAEKLQQAEATIAEQRAWIEEAQQKIQAARTDQTKEQEQNRQEIESLRSELTKQAAEFLDQIPDLEQRVHAALDRTSAARDLLRGQLNELHAYARQSQDDLDRLRSQVQVEIETLRQQEVNLQRSRSDHRLVVSSFRQQLMEWQSRFSEMKQLMAQNQNRIGEREAKVEATSQELAVQAVTLAVKEEKLEVEKKEVEEIRTEVDRHLTDMREWYRQKLREIVESRNQRPEGSSAGSSNSQEMILPLSEVNRRTQSESAENSQQQATILSLADDLDPVDKRLGEMLQSLELVDTETLMGLWSESRRLRRPLRQVLLAGGYLTLYQLALIESGSLSKLMIGRFRVIDRLIYSSRESIYRVIDPQRIQAKQDRPLNAIEMGQCILRQLGEAEMADEVRPDEYRQRFTAARDIAHRNLATTFEVLEISGRPAVVQEWLIGLASSDWPAIVASADNWIRLVSQCALGLYTGHQMGLVHGHLSRSSFLLTTEGVVKMTGWGTPPWLYAPNLTNEPTEQDDLRALGEIAYSWSQQTIKGKKNKARPFPTEWLGLLLRLGVNTGAIAEAEPYAHAGELLEDLDRIREEITVEPANWETLMAYVRENQTDAPLLRQSA